MRKSAVEALVAFQREDGGWAQASILTSDAYATGQSLYALHLPASPLPILRTSAESTTFSRPSGQTARGTSPAEVTLFNH